jgi:RHS repeat-associated protein
MSTTNNGVDLTTGKINLPITLASISGPNSFNESLSISYSTLGLLGQIKTWNQDAPTGLLGLGWAMSTPYIARIGNGSINDTFYLNSSMLLLKAKTGTSESGYQLEFETAAHSMSKISYDSTSETWTVVDTNGVTYVYGGNSTNTNATEYAVRWVAEEGQPSPKVWIDSSIETDTQQLYALIWNLSYKVSAYGQRIDYKYSKVSQNIGANSSGKEYDIASYLVGIQIENGASLKLNYTEKEAWEYPCLRIQYNTDGSTTNAYQDRISTCYLSSLSLYDTTGVIQQNIKLDYGFLYENLGSEVTRSAQYPQINKRILTAIHTLTPDGLAYAPAQVFDYWGYHDDGFASCFGSFLSYAENSLLKLTDTLLASVPAFVDPSNSSQTYQPLFGHLKNIQSPTGAVVWYSYNEVSANYKSVWNDGSWEKHWPNLLQSVQINHPDGAEVSQNWDNARPYWGPDNYVVIRWDNKDEKQICLQLFEWVSGQWVLIPCGANSGKNYFGVNSFDDNHIIISVSNGKFALVRTDYSASDGAITLFNRDPYLPGEWHLTYYLPNQQIPSGYVSSLPAGENNSYLPQVGLGNNVAAILDKLNNNLYLYSLDQNGIWSEYSTNPINVLPTGKAWGRGGVMTSLAVTAQEVFVVFADTSQHFYYWLYYYDPIQGITSNNLVAQPWADGDLFVGYDNALDPGINSLGLSQGSGFLLLASTLVTDSNAYIENYINRSVVISWDDDRAQVSFQKIQNYLNDGSNSWGVSGESKWLIQPSTIPNEVASTSNLINQTWMVQDKNSEYGYNKQILRFTGSNTSDAAGNYGWNLDYTLQNLSDNSDSWVIMATLDTTVATTGTSDTYSYQLYQYDPIQGWIPQSNVEMGENKDWEAVLATLSKVMEYINITFMMAGSLMAPFGLIAGELGSAAVAASALFDITNAIVTNPVSTTALSYAELAFIRDQLSGRRDGAATGQNYLLVGTQKTGTLNAYYKEWNGSSYSWISLGEINPTDPLVALGDAPTGGIAEDTYFYCGNFGIFGYTSVGHPSDPVFDATHYLNSDQVIIFRNGLVQTILCMPLATLPVDSGSHYDHLTNQTQVPYLNSNSTDHPYLMAAPWGGILGYLPITDDSGYTIKQTDISEVYFLALFKVQNENISGNVTDYVVNQVTLNDGYQHYNTFYQYMPGDAYLQNSKNAMFYNCVKVATGGSSYASSAQRYGWSENYFYTPKPGYNPATNGFIYDPAHTQDAQFLANNQDQTNVGQYLNLMLGKPYCQRIMKSQGGGDNSIGYEESRQYNFYKAYLTNLIDYTTGASIGEQLSGGVLSTLTLNLVAPDNNTQYTDINAAYAVQQAVLSMQYAFYDMDGFYSPWVPNSNASDGSMKFFIIQGGNTVYLNSALPYASLSVSFDISANGTALPITPCIKGKYQQYLTSLYISSFGAMGYDNFINLNLFTNLQSTTWINENLSFAVDSQHNPMLTSASFWQNGWEIIASQATTWRTMATHGNALNWYPGSNYVWQGNADGSKQIDYLDFAWVDAAKGSPIPNWVQGGMSTVVENGMTLASTNMINTPSAVIYNTNMTAPIASFTNSSVVNTPTFYMGFESYEDLSILEFYQGSTLTSLSSFLTNRYSNTGNCSVCLPQANETLYSWVKTFDVATITSEAWMAALNYLIIGQDVVEPSFEVRILDTAATDPGSTTPIVSLPMGVIDQWTSSQMVCMDLTQLIQDLQLKGTTLSIALDILVPAGYQNKIYIDNIIFAPVNNASFAITTYDSASKRPIAFATSTDYSFYNRTVYNNRGQQIATLRKQDTPGQASAISLTASYFYADQMVHPTPNTQFIMGTRGCNDNIAGNYFDFRDGQNPWSNGYLQNNLLLLSSGNSASYTNPIDNVSGTGIRIQLQGWVEQYQTRLQPGTTLVGLPTVASDASLEGVFTKTASSSFEDLFAFNIDTAGNITQQPNISITGTQPILNEGELFINNLEQDKLFGVFKGLNSSDQYYRLFNFLNGNFKQIYCSQTEPIYTPTLSVNSNLYFADQHHGLYGVDISQVDSQENVGFDVQLLVEYSRVLEGATCNAPPAANYVNTSIAFGLSNGNNAVIVKHDIISGFSPFAEIVGAKELNLSPIVADNGSVFIIDDNNQLHAYDTNINLVNTVLMSGFVVGNIVTGNGVVAVAFASGWLSLYDLKLELIASIRVANSIIDGPVINGDKISVIGLNGSVFAVYSYNAAGCLACAPYISTASQSLSIQTVSRELSDLIVISDNSLLTRLYFGVPSASLSIGSYQIGWDAAQSQYSLFGTPKPVNPVTITTPACGDWLFTVVNNILYFYADGQQIFAQAISTLPAESITYTIVSGDLGLAVRDIILINNPIMAVSYYDGANKLRQLQTLAEIVPPQTATSTETAEMPQVCILLREQLYDALGRNAINTVITAKGSSAVNQAAFAFESSFIDDRSGLNPAFTGAALAGQIQDWVDTRRFSQVGDTEYAYAGQYFEADPTARLLQNSAPGVDFNKDSDHSAAYTNGWLASGILNEVQGNLGLSIGQLSSQYGLRSKTVSLGTVGTLTQATVATLSGRTVSTMSMDANQPNHCIMQSAVQSIGANSSNGTPYMGLNLTFMPNAYDTQHSIQDPANYIITKKFNAQAQTIYSQRPDEGVTQSYYDNAGRLRFSQNADLAKLGFVNYYLYDALGRLIEMGSFISGWNIATFANYCQDLSTTSRPSGNTAFILKQFVYSCYNIAPTVFGQICTVFSTNTMQGGIGINADSQMCCNYYYNLQGQVVSVKMVNFSNENETYTTDYNYNSLNQVMGITYPDGFKVTYNYNIQGKIANVGYISDTQSSDYYATYQYDVNGKIINEILAQGALLTQHQYGNSLGQLTQLSTSLTSSGENLFTETISYTDQNGSYQNGNVQSATYLYGAPVSAATPNYSYQYQYDIFGRLIAADAYDTAKASSIAGWSMESSVIDANGNVQSVNQGGLPITYSYYPGTNQINTRTDDPGNYTYTASGLTSQTPGGKQFVYDETLRLPVQIDDVSFIYDYSGERVYKKAGADSILYIRGGRALSLLEIDQNKNAVRYIYGPLGLICIHDGQTNQDYFILKDHLNSTRVAYDNKNSVVAAYYTYLPYGKIVEQGGPQAASLRYLYTGQEWDAEIGLYNYHARQYDPSLGRFLTPDPAHQFPSPYAYVGNNPVNFCDQTGQTRSLPGEPTLISMLPEKADADQALNLRYFTAEERKTLRVYVNEEGKLYQNVEGDSRILPENNYMYTVGSDGALYAYNPQDPVLPQDMVMDIQHSSFFGGEEDSRLQLAGHFDVADGKITRIDNGSGHYQPTPENLQEGSIGLYQGSMLTEDTELSAIGGAQGIEMSSGAYADSTKLWDTLDLYGL